MQLYLDTANLGELREAASWGILSGVTTNPMHAGRNMAGDHAPYEHLPFFYSDLFDLGYEAVGELDARLVIVADWKEPFPEGSCTICAMGECAASCYGTSGTGRCRARPDR
jgi:hypothetical protein